MERIEIWHAICYRASLATTVKDPQNSQAEQYCLHWRNIPDRISGESRLMGCIVGLEELRKAPFLIVSLGQRHYY